MSKRRIIVVGASHGGVQLGASLRLDGFDGHITLIEREAGLPYQRPPLSKAFMKDPGAPPSLLRPASFYRANSIELLSGVSVTAIDRARKLVKTSDSVEHAFDHLVIACGSRNIIPSLPGIGCAGVYNLRTLDDAIALRSALARAGKIAVIGGGFIGLEFAAVARGLGVEVIVIEAADRLMARVVSADISSFFLGMHRENGTRVLLGTAVTGIISDGSGRGAGVKLADGRIIEAEAILVAVGVRPETQLAEEAGLALENGIAVDGLLTTSDPSISAIGDCASFPVAGTASRIRIESVQAATDQARTVSQRLTGHSAEYDAVPWFWSDQGHFKLQIAGLTAGADIFIKANPGPGQTSVLCFSNNVLIGVETINAPAEHMAARKLFAARRPVFLKELENESFSVAGLLAKLNAPKPAAICA